MAKEVSKTVIGAFVISAIVLIVIGVITFGSGRFFKETVQCILFFQGSVKGLSEGSPVVWRGVKIGSVKEIILFADQQDMRIDIPVIIEIEPGRFRVKTAEGVREGKASKESLERLVQIGLKARLTMQSIVTGQLMIDMDLHPDKPVKLVGMDEFPYAEIPTLQSTLEQLTETVQKLPIKEIVEKMEKAIDNIAEIAGDPELKEMVANAKTAVQNVNQLIKNTDTLVGNVDRQVEPLANSITTTAEDAQKLIRNVDGHVDPVALKIEETIDTAKAALEQAEETLEGIEEVTADGSVTHHRLTKALEEVSRAARAVRVLFDYLEQYPDAPLRGKAIPGGK